jgi:hypothetical protein
METIVMERERMAIQLTRSDVRTKQQILVALRESLSAVEDWIESQRDAAFEQGPAGRWSMGQHLEHLTLSVQPFTLAMSLPRFVLSLALPKVARPGMSYAELAARYEGVLDAGGKASGRYVPPVVPVARKAASLAAHRAQRDKLLRQVAAFPEAEMDRLGAKHPLIGVLSLRELLFFTVHHHDHHLQTLQRDYGA